MLVIFRKWYKQEDGSDVIALFPAEEEPRRPGIVQSYEHVGQHGAADLAGVIERTKPATPEEYASLKRELESPPFNYNLKVIQRRPH